MRTRSQGGARPGRRRPEGRRDRHRPSAPITAQGGDHQGQPAPGPPAQDPGRPPSPCPPAARATSPTPATASTSPCRVERIVPPPVPPLAEIRPLSSPRSGCSARSPKALEAQRRRSRRARVEGREPGGRRRRRPAPRCSRATGLTRQSRHRTRTSAATSWAAPSPPRPGEVCDRRAPSGIVIGQRRGRHAPIRPDRCASWPRERAAQIAQVAVPRHGRGRPALRAHQAEGRRSTRPAPARAVGLDAGGRKATPAGRGEGRSDVEPAVRGLSTDLRRAAPPGGLDAG